MTPANRELVIAELTKAQLSIQNAYHLALKSGDGSYAGELRSLAVSVGSSLAAAVKMGKEKMGAA